MNYEEEWTYLAFNSVYARHGASLGNEIGRARLIRRLESVMGPSVLRIGFYGEPNSKQALLSMSHVKTSGQQLAVVEDMMMWRRNRPVEVRLHEALIIRRHALVRAVQRAGVREVSAVFRFLK